VRRGYDGAVVDAFIVVPPLVAVAWYFLLSGRFDEAAVAVVWLVLAVALRPAVWFWAARRERVSPAQARAYEERERYAANTSFAAMVVLLLMTIDIVPLPGGPYWTSQPRASFAMVPVVVYLYWLAQRATIPDEVACGWRRLLGKEG
jgi:hypothetical protein